MAIQDILTEIDNLHAKMAEYEAAISAYMFDPENNPLPNLNDVITDLTMDEATAYIQNNKDAAVDQSMGAVSQVVYKYAGFMRETSNRYRTKASFYAQGIGQRAIQSEELTADSGETVSEFRSTTPEQDEGT